MEDQYSGKHRFNVGDVVRVTEAWGVAGTGTKFTITGRRFCGAYPCYEYEGNGGADAEDENCWWDGFLELVHPATLENV